MTAKRFTVFGEWHKDNVIDEIRDNTGEFVTIGRCVDLLNENEELKFELDECRNHKLFSRRQLEQENEQLEQFLQSLAEQCVCGKVMLRDGKVYDLNKILKKGDVE